MNLKKIILKIIIIIFFIVTIFFQKNINKENIFKQKEESSFKINKIIIVGDSRMELMNNNRVELNIPNNVMFVALSGAKISWLYEEGFSKIFELIKDNFKYKYSIVFNMGVNDLDSSTDPNKLASDYFKIYKKIIEKNKNIDFYLLSVNPVIEILVPRYFGPQKRTNERIEQFNNYFVNKLTEEKLNNVKYCDSYNSLEFEIPDGLHYSLKTDKEIINYIIKDCVNINLKK